MNLLKHFVLRDQTLQQRRNFALSTLTILVVGYDGQIPQLFCRLTAALHLTINQTLQPLISAVKEDICKLVAVLTHQH